MEAVFNNSADGAIPSALKEMKSSLSESESKRIQVKDDGCFLVRIYSINDWSSLPDICSVYDETFFKSKRFFQHERLGETFAYAMFHVACNRNSTHSCCPAILKREQLTSLL